MKFLIPKIILKALEQISLAGKDYFIIGGCVRDIFLKRNPNDWDITTNATPEELLLIFKKSNEFFSGAIYTNQFGTVSVLAKSKEENLKIIEITTFRSDGKYTDKRHPEKITFSKKLEDDVARRDFTINAVALKPKKFDKELVECEIFDFYNGVDDIKLKLIRAVGDPSVRFDEDALRILRAIRLAVQLGFFIEENTLKAIKEKISTVDLVSKERVRDEIIKIALNDNASLGIKLMEEVGLLKILIPELCDCIGVSQNKHHIYTVYEHCFRAFDYACMKNFSLEVRLASLLHDIGKPCVKEGEGKDCTFYNHEVVSAKLTEKILKRLKFPNYILEKVVLLVKYHQFFYDPEINSDASLRRLLKKVGKENVLELAQVREADRIGSGCPKALPFRLRHFLFRIEKVLKELEGEVPSLKMLKINGNDLIQFDIKEGRKIGYILNILLEDVLDDPESNIKEELINKSIELNKLSLKELKEKSLKAKEKYISVLSEEEREIKRKYHV